MQTPTRLTPFDDAIVSFNHPANFQDLKKTFTKNDVQNIVRTINDSKNIKAKDLTKLAAKIHNFYNKTIKS